jgi:hypothetical protein
MPYSLQYKKLIESETKVSKSRLKPRRIYKITTYKYADGHQKTLSGANTSYIFCTGVFHKKLYGIKLSLIKPEKFFVWLKQVFKKHLTEAQFADHTNLADILQVADKAGTKMFNSYLKGKQIYEKEPSAFRTYNIESIGQISEITLKKEVLMASYGLKLTETVDTKKEEDKTKPSAKESN